MILKSNRYLVYFLTIVFMLILIGHVSGEQVGIGNSTSIIEQDEDQLRPEHIPIILTSIISFFTFLIGSTVVLYIYFLKRNKQRHEEIMSLIEKGEYDPTMFEAKRKYRKETFLLSAIVLIAIGAALIIGIPTAAKASEGIIAGLIPFFVGCGLLVFYFVLKRTEKSE